MQITLITHDDYGQFLWSQAVFGSFDELDGLANNVKTGSVRNAVNQDKTIGPLNALLFFSATFFCWLLWQIRKKKSLKSNNFLTVKDHCFMPSFGSKLYFNQSDCFFTSSAILQCTPLYLVFVMKKNYFCITM